MSAPASILRFWPRQVKLALETVGSMALWTQPTEAVITPRNPIGRSVGLHESLSLTRDVDAEMDALLGLPKNKQS